MTYFAFPGGWGVYDLNGVDEKTLASTGAHGYATKAQALAHVNASPDMLQAGILQGFKAESNLPVGAGESGDNSTPDSGTGWALKIGNTTGLLARFLKVVIGGVMLLAGILKMTNADKAVLGVAGQAAGRLPGI